MPRIITHKLVCDVCNTATVECDPLIEGWFFHWRQGIAHQSLTLTDKALAEGWRFDPEAPSSGKWYCPKCRPGG